MSLPRHTANSLGAEGLSLRELLAPLASPRTGMVSGMTVLPPSHGNEDVSHSSSHTLVCRLL